MLPDFPELKAEARRILDAIYRARIQKDPFIGRVKKETIHEGDRCAIRRNDGTWDETSLTEIVEKTPIDTDAVREVGLKALVDGSAEAAERFKGQQLKMMFGKLRELTEKTGNVVDAAGKPFTYELFLDLLKKVDIDFDESGEPHMPTMVVAPELGAKIAAEIPKWQENQVYIDAFDDVMRQKKEDWLARESVRKLVD